MNRITIWKKSELDKYLMDIFEQMLKQGAFIGKYVDVDWVKQEATEWQIQISVKTKKF